MENCSTNSRNINSVEEFSKMQSLSNFWVDELEFLNLEQKFLYQILTKKVLKKCNNYNFKKAKMYIECLKNEDIIGAELFVNSKENKANISLLMEGIHLKKEEDIKEFHNILALNFDNFTSNFRVLKKEIMDLVLHVFDEDKSALDNELAV